MVVTAVNYLDFKIAAKSLRHLDAVFYNNATTIQGSGPYAVAYAFDYQSGTCVVSQVVNGDPLSLTDFPHAIELSSHLKIDVVSHFASDT